MASPLSNGLWKVEALWRAQYGMRRNTLKAGTSKLLFLTGHYLVQIFTPYFQQEIIYLPRQEPLLDFLLEEFTSHRRHSKRRLVELLNVV